MCALQTGWAAIFIELILSYLLIGTENIGVQIEEPFSIMPLMEFCKGMEKSIVDIMECYRGDLPPLRHPRSTTPIPPGLDILAQVRVLVLLCNGSMRCPPRVTDLVGFLT